MVWQYLLRGWLEQQAKQKLYEAAQKAMAGQAKSGQAGAAGEDETQAAVEELGPCEIGVVMALGIELGGAVDLLQNQTMIRGEGFEVHLGRFADRSVALVQSGAGREAAARATQALIAGHRPAWVVSAGFAGGLAGQLKKFDFLFADQVVDTQGGKFTIDLGSGREQLAAAKHVHSGRLLTVDEIIRTAAEKRDLGQRYDALGVDMETLAVAQACSQHGVRLLSVRIVSDCVDDELPPEVLKLMNPQSTARKLGTALGAIVNRPGSMKDMWKLREDALVAAVKLAKFLTGVVTQLH